MVKSNENSFINDKPIFEIPGAAPGPFEIKSDNKENIKHIKHKLKDIKLKAFGNEKKQIQTTIMDCFLGKI